MRIKNPRLQISRARYMVWGIKRTKVVNDKRPNDVQPLFFALFQGGKRLGIQKHTHTCTHKVHLGLEWKYSRFYCHIETGSTRHRHTMHWGKTSRQLLFHKWGASSRWRDYHIRAHIGCGEPWLQHPHLYRKQQCPTSPSPAAVTAPAAAAAPASDPDPESETWGLTGSRQMSVCRLHSGFHKQHVLFQKKKWVSSTRQKIQYYTVIYEVRGNKEIAPKNQL